MKGDGNRKQVVRLLQILAKNSECVFEYSKDQKSVLVLSKSGQTKLNCHIVKIAVRIGVITAAKGKLLITQTGVSFLKRQMCDHDPFQNQHRSLENRVININHGKQSVSMNCAESPLSRLYARKQKSGTRYITLDEFEAGEQIRRDFEKAGLQPMVTSNWGGGGSKQKNTGTANMARELSDIAIDAKVRFEKAVNALGPELTGITIDVCCFLKGFEGVERERGWPNRSAKLMLKMALAKLARHYGYCAPMVYRSFDRTGEIGSWGAPDYRPSL